MYHNPRHEKLFYNRINQAIDRVELAVIEHSTPLEITWWNTGKPVEGTSFDDRLQGDYQPIKEGDIWGQRWDLAWFHITGKVPAEYAGKEVQLWVNITTEGCVYHADGTVEQHIGFSSIWDARAKRPFVPLLKQAKGGEPIDLWLEGSVAGYFGVTPLDDVKCKDIDRNDPTRFGERDGKVEKIRIAAFNRTAWELVIDMKLMLSLYDGLHEGSVRRAKIFKALQDCCDILGSSPKAFDEARASLKPIMSLKTSPSELDVYAVGHAHIDTGWLWPVREGRRKCVRTFANQMQLIDAYPGYIFGASQPQHYQFVKEDQPELYARIKQAVKDGTWELQGGMWVESDCNLTSGESLVRQFIHGKNFFMDEFGKDVTNLWIPDVFGYSAALPQIMHQAGVDTFLTQKISWNQFNEFPYNTFLWQGIDGTEILTHFPPENTYNSDMDPKSLIEAQQRFKEKALASKIMSLFGVGDGGGGPRADHIERALRMNDLEGCPRVQFNTAEKFFESLHDIKNELPKWVGELYLEYHRGTLTTQALVKKQNRQLELRLREMEMLCSCSDLASYPIAEFDTLWKTLLLNHFHDIIPGSSINNVYKVTHQEHADMLAKLDAMQQQIAPNLLTADVNSVVYFNALSHTWTGMITLPTGWNGATQGGNPLDTQAENDGVTAWVIIEPLGSIELKKAENKAALQTVNDLVLENDLVKYTFNKAGQLISAFDKQAQREALREAGNVMSLYNDRPTAYDAWDIDAYHRTEYVGSTAVQSLKLEQGPVRSVLTLTASLGEMSTMTQKITLDFASKRLDFDTTINWAEQHKLLKVAFPTSINSPEASCDIQYGYIKRPTHVNTSWDMARFEVAAHKYIDMSEPTFGVALLNDCKYGHRILDNSLELTLLRSPTWPDPDADMGIHQFTYSLLPHVDDMVRSDVMVQARCLNQKPVCFTGFAGKIESPVKLEAANATLEVLKRAEKANHLVARIVESHGQRGTAVLTVPAGCKVIMTNLMEWTDGDVLPVVDGKVTVALKPFEIVTVKIVN
jgi:alpha-mannosidase